MSDIERSRSRALIPEAHLSPKSRVRVDTIRKPYAKSSSALLDLTLSYLKRSNSRVLVFAF